VRLVDQSTLTFSPSRARQNVIHEIGLFQGKLGFRKLVLILQKGLEEFSNVAGLQYIDFEGDRIDAAFYQLRAVLEREKMLE
jgi:predicted nucleotide-binding protein